MCTLVHSPWDLVYARRMSVIGLSVLMVHFTGMWIVFNLHVASNQFNVSMGTWLHLWIFIVSAWHIDAAQNGCSYQNIKHAKHT